MPHGMAAHRERIPRVRIEDDADLPVDERCGCHQTETLPERWHAPCCVHGSGQSDSKKEGTTMSTGSRGQQSQGIGSPISNEAYNVLAALHAKLEGLEAMRKFSAEGNQQLWQQLSERDNQAVQVLVQELERLVQEGRLRPGQPGQAR